MLRWVVLLSLAALKLPALEVAAGPAPKAILALLAREPELARALSSVTAVVTTDQDPGDDRGWVRPDDLTDAYAVLDHERREQPWQILLDHPHPRLAQIALAHLLDQAQGCDHPDVLLVDLIERLIRHQMRHVEVAPFPRVDIDWPTDACWQALLDDTGPQSQWRVVRWLLDQDSFLDLDSADPVHQGAGRLCAQCESQPGAPGFASLDPERFRQQPVACRRRWARLRELELWGGGTPVPGAAALQLQDFLADPDDQVLAAGARLAQERGPRTAQDLLAIVSGCSARMAQRGALGVLCAGVVLQTLASAATADRDALPWPLGSPQAVQQAWLRLLMGLHEPQETLSQATALCQAVLSTCTPVASQELLGVERVDLLADALMDLGRRHPALALRIAAALEGLTLSTRWMDLGDGDHPTLASAGCYLAPLLSRLPVADLPSALQVIQRTLRDAAPLQDPAIQARLRELTMRLATVLRGWLDQQDACLQSPGVLRALLAEIPLEPTWPRRLLQELLPEVVAALERDPTCQLELPVLTAIDAAQPRGRSLLLRLVRYVPEDRLDLMGTVLTGATSASPAAWHRSEAAHGLDAHGPWARLLDAERLRTPPARWPGPLADPAGVWPAASAVGAITPDLDICYAALDAARASAESRAWDPAMLLLRWAIQGQLATSAGFARLPAELWALDHAMDALLRSTSARLRRLAVVSWAECCTRSDLPLTTLALQLAHSDADALVRAASYQTLQPGHRTAPWVARGLSDPDLAVAGATWQALQRQGRVPGQVQDLLLSPHPWIRQQVAAYLQQHPQAITPQLVRRQVASRQVDEITTGLAEEQRWLPSLFQEQVEDRRVLVRLQSMQELTQEPARSRLLSRFERVQQSYAALGAQILDLVPAAPAATAAPGAAPAAR